MVHGAPPEGSPALPGASRYRDPARIARDDSDRRMRSRALFWLGQKDDPRVTKMIGDRVLR